MTLSLRADAPAFVPQGSSPVVGIEMLDSTKQQQRLKDDNHRKSKKKSSMRKQSGRKRYEKTNHQSPCSNASRNKESRNQRQQQQQQQQRQQQRLVKDDIRTTHQTKDVPNGNNQQRRKQRHDRGSYQKRHSPEMNKVNHNMINYFDEYQEWQRIMEGSTSQQQWYGTEEEAFHKSFMDESLPPQHTTTTTTTTTTTMRESYDNEGTRATKSSSVAVGAWADTTSLIRALARNDRQVEATSPKSDEKSSLEQGNLTLLTSSRNRKSKQQITSSIETYRNETKKSVTVPSNNKKSEWNMVKMRDKWWALLRDRTIIPPVNETKQKDATVAADVFYDNGEDKSVEYFSPIPLATLTSPVQVLDEIYLHSDIPLHEAIKRGDEAAVRLLLRKGGYSATIIKEGVTMAVHLDNARILRILVSAGSTRTVNDDAGCTAPCLAALKGQAECLAVFLETSTLYLLQKDSRGNTPLHLLCVKKSSHPMLSLCLKRLKTDALSSFVNKLLLQTNDRGETCLHVASSNGRADFVEMFLNFASISLLSKLLSIQDQNNQTPLLAAVASGSIDTVMSFFMWSGNNSLVTLKVEPTAPSPLLWAASLCHADMVNLLLDFYHGAENKKDLDSTLRVVVRLPGIGRKTKSKHAIIRQLIISGANPCSEESDTNMCALEIAATKHDYESLEVLLNSFEVYLKTLSSSRRQDPVLKQQPESFFQGKESCEKAQLQVAIRNALTISTLNALKSEDEQARYIFEDCTMLLYEKGAVLDLVGLNIIRNVLGKPSRSCESAVSPETFYTVQHDPPPCSLLADFPHKPLSQLYSDKKVGESAFLWPLVAMSNNFSWITSKQREHFKMIQVNAVDARNFDVVLESNDGEIFEANCELLANLSAKLAAALRFSRLQSSSDTTAETLPIPANGSLCRLLLQHMYYGSIFEGLPEDSEQCCRVLLDLVVLAENLICESLLQECEIRLLSHNPRQCQCYVCGIPGIKDSTFRRMCSGPSKCVTIDTSLDILATADHLESFFSDMSYTIRNGADLEWLPFQKVRHVVAESCISNNFVKLFDSSAFQSQIAISSGTTEDFKHLVLRYCLNEFVSGEKAKKHESWRHSLKDGKASQNRRVVHLDK